jgi:hypothetical protein
MPETVDRRLVIVGGAIAALIIAVLVIVLFAPSDDSSAPADEFVQAPTATSTPVSGGGGGGGGSAPAGIEDSLSGLGVDTSASERVAPDNEPLPDNYSPLGSSPSFGDSAVGSDESGLNKTDELLIVGTGVEGAGGPLALVELLDVQIDGNGNIDPGTTSLLQSFDVAENAWATTTGARNGDSDDTRQLRAVAAGDVDRDGFEEVVVVYVDTSSADRVLKLRIIEDPADGFATAEETLGDGDDILDLSVVTGDFNGDGTAQIVVGLGFAEGAELRFVQDDNGRYRFDDASTKSYGISFPDRTIVTLELASGNLDYDNPTELGLVVNEFTTISGTGPTGAATFYLYDDGSTGFEELDSGPVQGRDGAVVTAVVADIDFGDVDGDGLAEVVMGGLAEFETSCERYDAFVTVRDDAEHAFAALDTDTFDAFFRNCPAFGPWRLRFLHVAAFDVDGDGADELHANLRVYEDLTESSELTLIHELPQELFVDRDSDAGARISSATTAMATGDVTGDGRENLIVYTQWQPDIHVWGLSAIESVGFAELSTIETSSRFNTQGRPEPLVLPVNLDTDSPSLKYSDGEYQLVFTEPLVVAALAAAPCSEGIGQNLEACATAFGQGETTSVAAELTVTVKAGIHAGVESEAKLPIVGGVSASLKESVTVTASLSAGAAYTVEKSRTFTTGSLEDGVVFTTIPYDRYTYTILSHPDPDLVGGTVIVSLPREPIILKVDRNFYNANIVESSITVDEQVFDHIPGVLDSYPGVGRKNELLRGFGGLENGPISVGQGGGSSGLEIAVSTEVSLGGSLGIEYEKEVEVTAGPAMVGYTVGYGVEASLSVTSGSQTTYSVEVGDLDGDNFAANQYSYGIFTYTQELAGQEFEVINFWVE